MNDTTIETVNKICAQLPPGWMIELCMERGAGVWVNLVDPQGGYPNLPGFGNETIVEQLEGVFYIAQEKART